jgi:uncharacterized protein DUF664
MNRRSFLATSAVISAASSGLNLRAQQAAKDDADIYIIGPRDGYSAEIGTLVSMMINMRSQVVHNVHGLSQADLDYLLDDKANTIGALLLHLAATDTYYRLHTFEEKPWGSWDESIKKQWDVAMNLGEPARKAIKGHDLHYYLDILEETRAKTFAEFRKRDDKWLLSRDRVSPDWGNYYAEWFHVCEHESNHDGQIKFLKSRLPSAKSGKAPE